MQSVDLVIIGAGPAGVSTALHLLQLDPGWSGRLLLLEKATHPRHKLCGGGVTRLGLERLAELGFDLPLPLPQARVDDIRLKYASRVIHVRGQPQFVVFHRPEFDAYLADQARRRGALIRENEAVMGLSVVEGGVVVETTQATYRAQAVVGADGARGISRRIMNSGKQPTRVARLLEVVQPAPETAEHFSQRYALFDFSPVHKQLQGYFWDFPACINGEAHFNRGVYDARFAARRARARLPELLHQGLRSRGKDPQEVKLEGHPIHWFSPRSIFSKPRLLLVGDAAGADPLFGEGIAPALEYGRVAAESLQTAFAAGDFSFRDYRSRLLRSHIGHYLLLRWFVAWWSYRLSGSAWFMHTLWSFGKALAASAPRPAALYED